MPERELEIAPGVHLPVLGLGVQGLARGAA